MPRHPSTTTTVITIRLHLRLQHLHQRGILILPLNTSKLFRPRARAVAAVAPAMMVAPKQPLALEEPLALKANTISARKNIYENEGVRIIMHKKKTTTHIAMFNPLAVQAIAAVGTLDLGAARSMTLAPVARATIREN